MKSTDIIAFCILGIFTVIAAIMCDRQSQEIRSIHARIDLVESQVGRGNIPRITVTGRTSIYSADGEIVLQELEK